MCILSVAAGALMSGCVVEPDGSIRLEPMVIGTPPPVVVAPEPAVIAPPEPVMVPESYVWDGVEFVGVVGDQYFYLGPDNVWVVCDPVRLERFHGWERGHPDWREHAIHNDRFRNDSREHGQPQKVAPKKRKDEH